MWEQHMSCTMKTLVHAHLKAMRNGDVSLLAKKIPHLALYHKFFTMSLSIIYLLQCCFCCSFSSFFFFCQQSSCIYSWYLKVESILDQASYTVAYLMMCFSYHFGVWTYFVKIKVFQLISWALVILHYFLFFVSYFALNLYILCNNVKI